MKLISAALSAVLLGSIPGVLSAEPNLRGGGAATHVTDFEDHATKLIASKRVYPPPPPMPSDEENFGIVHHSGPPKPSDEEDFGIVHHFGPPKPSDEEDYVFIEDFEDYDEDSEDEDEENFVHRGGIHGYGDHEDSPPKPSDENLVGYTCPPLPRAFCRKFGWRW